MKNKKTTIAAILAAVDQYEAETQAAVLQLSEKPRPIIVSNWKYYGVGEMMRMRTTWQLRLCNTRPMQRR
ncbi:MAG: hypothetical protein WC562_02475 [Dehalococcoidia bacterium]|jgi:hypothetical protein